MWQNARPMRHGVTGNMWRAHADALASVIDSVAGHGCVSKKCYQIWQFSVKSTTFLQTFFKHFVFRGLSGSKTILNLSFKVRGDKMSKILVGMSLYDGLKTAPFIRISRRLALIKEIWLAYATWTFGKTFYYSVFCAGSMWTLGFSRFLSKTLFRQFY